MKAIFFASNYYESPIQVGDHHLARKFAQDGWKIAYISTPISPFHLMKWNNGDLSDRLNNYKNGGISYTLGDGSIWAYVPGAVLVPQNKIILSSKMILTNWYRFTFPNLHKILSDMGFSDVDLLYFRDPKFGLWREKIKHAYSIYRIADHDRGFKNFNKNHQSMELDLAKNVDLVVYTAKELNNYIKKFSPKKTFYLPNGVDLSNFLKNEYTVPETIRTLTKPIVVYVGSIEYWFDYVLINKLTSALPEVSFLMIGPNNLPKGKLVPRDNLILLGRINYEEIPDYLYSAQIGIIPFDVKKYPDLVNSINPLKLYEYFACGLPVVATKWHELENINPPAFLCENTQEFLEAIKIALGNKFDAVKLKEFAYNNDWSNRYCSLIKEMNK